MKPEKRTYRAVIILILIGILIAMCFAVSIASQWVARIEESVNIANQNAIRNRPISEKKLREIVSVEINQSIPTVKDGANGKNGANGKDGKDSVSTNTQVIKETVVQEKTIVKEQEPGVDGRTIQIGKTPAGVLIYKYEGERDWFELPIVNVAVGRR